MSDQPAPVALLLNLEPGTPKGDALHELFAQAGVKVVDVQESQLGDTVAHLVGLPGHGPSLQRADPAPHKPATEFVLLANMSGAQATKLTAAMRKAGAPVGCKAMLTEHNQAWPFIQLVEEVASEHAYWHNLKASRDAH